MRNIKHTILILSAIAVSGCKKDHSAPTNLLNGTYKGQLFADEKNDAFHTGSITSDVSIKFSTIFYNSISNPITNNYSGYTGTLDGGKYVVVGQKINLQNPSAYPEMFDHNLILGGDYTYTIKGDSLILSKKINDNTYLYKLKKQ